MYGKIVSPLRNVIATRDHFTLITVMMDGLSYTWYYRDSLPMTCYFSCQEMTTVQKYAKLLDRTHQYFLDVGAAISIKKSFNFSSTATSREWLTNTLWPIINHTILVMTSFKYLGAHITTNARSSNDTVKPRFNNAIAMLARTRYLPMTQERRAAVIRTKIIPSALYGCEVAGITDTLIQNITTAILRAITQPGTTPET